MLRIPAAGRVEDRTIDGACNPYLAATVVLAAGLDGIERKLDPGEPNTDNLYAISHDELRGRGLETLPANLLEATHELERDDVLRAALGRARDEDYLDYFVRVKRDEWARYHEQVSPWELTEYLTSLLASQVLPDGVGPMPTVGAGSHPARLTASSGRVLPSAAKAGRADAGAASRPRRVDRRGRI